MTAISCITYPFIPVDDRMDSGEHRRVAEGQSSPARRRTRPDRRPRAPLHRSCHPVGASGNRTGRFGVSRSINGPDQPGPLPRLLGGDAAHIRAPYMDDPSLRPHHTGPYGCGRPARPGGLPSPICPCPVHAAHVRRTRSLGGDRAVVPNEQALQAQRRGQDGCLLPGPAHLDRWTPGAERVVDHPHRHGPRCLLPRPDAPRDLPDHPPHHPRRPRRGHRRRRLCGQPFIPVLRRHVRLRVLCHSAAGVVARGRSDGHLRAWAIPPGLVGGVRDDRLDLCGDPPPEQLRVGGRPRHPGHLPVPVSAPRPSRWRGCR